MAFLESSGSNNKVSAQDGFREVGDREAEGGTGLPTHWHNLLTQECPLCGDELIEFEHIRMWKCGCGFKISSYRFEQIVEDIEEQEEGDTIARGFLFGD